MDDGPHLIVCALVRELDNPVDGSTQTFCTQCKEQIWMSPSSVRLNEREPELQPVCQYCGAAKAIIHKQQGDEVKVAAVTSEQVEELMAWARRERGMHNE